MGTYKRDYAEAARRHLRAGQELYQHNGPGAQPGCRAVAGYLFGLAGELAVKQMMRASGVKPQDAWRRRDEPLYSHFPALKSLLVDQVSGRRAGDLRRIAENPSLFRKWDTDIRYAPTDEIQGALITEWKSSAEALVDSMGL